MKVVTPLAEGRGEMVLGFTSGKVGLMYPSWIATYSLRFGKSLYKFSPGQAVFPTSVCQTILSKIRSRI